MKAKFSPLELLKFELLDCSYKFNLDNDEEIDAQILFKTYSVDIEFDHFFDENETIRVFTEIKVNHLKKPKNGYSLSILGIGIFKLDLQKGTDEKLLDNLKFYSTLNMMINNLRNMIFQMSNLSPLGGYLLPPVDILDLFKKKQKKNKNEKEA